MSQFENADTAPGSEAVTTTEADARRLKMGKVMIGAAVVASIGSFLPWASALGEEGLGGFSWGPGKVTLVCAVLLGLYGAQPLRKDDPRVRHHGWAIAAVSVGLVVAMGSVSLLDEIDSFTFGAADVQMGNGLLITMLALGFAIWPLVVLRRDDRVRQGLHPAPQAPARVAPATPVQAPAGSEESATQATDEGTVPDWYPDPLGRFEHRYHDGTRWTEHVSRDGEAAEDPID